MCVSIYLHYVCAIRHPCVHHACTLAIVVAPHPVGVEVIGKSIISNNTHQNYYNGNQHSAVPGEGEIVSGDIKPEEEELDCTGRTH